MLIFLSNVKRSHALPGLGMATLMLFSLSGPGVTKARAEDAPREKAKVEQKIPRSERPAGAQVYLISPADGETVTSPVIVRFGLDGMGVAPAGVAMQATGHHHLLIDVDPPSPDLPIPKNDHYRHFGNGQTEVTLELSPGKHTLQLMLGDHMHVPHDPPVVSRKITINVAK